MKRLFPMVFALIVVGGVLIMAFPPRAWMQRVVEDFGFHDVHLTGFALLGCSESDSFRQRWTGQNAGGRQVDGVVCGGLANDWTVRLS